MKPVHVIGGGLAGSEATWQLAQAGVPVVLHEMRPQTPTDVHQTDGLAELVCSNSFLYTNIYMRSTTQTLSQSAI